MESEVNQDMGLTPQEEEELLALNPEEEIIIDEEDEAPLNEFEGSNWDFSLSKTKSSESLPRYVKVENPEETDFKEPFNSREANPRTSTPVKRDLQGDPPSFGKTSPNHQDSRLGGFKIPRTTTIIRTRTLQKGPDPEPDLEIVAEIKTISRKRDNIRPKKERTQPDILEEETGFLEEGEISPSEEAASLENKMGNKTSLPRVLRAVVDVLEEREIEEEQPVLPQEPAPPAEDPSRPLETETPKRARVEREKESARPAWKKNGGRGVKGRAAKREVIGGHQNPERPRSMAPESALDHLGTRRRPLSPFKERSVQSLPDVEKIVCAGRPFHWRERGGSQTQGSRVTPKNFRPGFQPRKKELRADGIVSQRERERVQEREEKLGRQGTAHPVQTTGGLGTQPHEEAKGVSGALSELEEAGTKYQEMLATFAAKYDVPRGESAPLKKKKIGEEEGKVPPVSGPAKGSHEEAGPSRKEKEDLEDDGDLNATLEMFPKVWELDADGAAINVRAAEPEIADGESPSTDSRDPVFSFRPPQPAVWPPDCKEEKGVELELEASRGPQAQLPVAAPLVPRGPQALLPVAPLAPQHPIFPPRQPWVPLHSSRILSQTKGNRNNNLGLLDRD